MERYLLFDGGCMLCTGLAQDIERETNGWLTVKSLRDAAMKELLDKARPGWKWEPMLVEVDGERVQVYTGIKMRSRLAVKLGPKRALHVAQLVQQALTPKSEVDQGRRTLLKRGAMLAGLAIVGPRVSMLATPTSTAVSKNMPPRMKDTKPLKKGDKLLDKLQKHPHVLTYEQGTSQTFGPLVWDDASLATYEGEATQALLIPIDVRKGSKDKERQCARTLIAYYDPGIEKLLEPVVFEMVAEEHVTDITKFSGTMRFYAPDGAVLTGASFKNGKFVATTSSAAAHAISRGPGLQAPLGYTYSCWRNCTMNDAWPCIPFVLQMLCAGACGTCFGGILPACAFCIGCLGGVALGCARCCDGIGPCYAPYICS